MNFIVLDLEWNQSPDKKAPVSEQMLFEIIQIGAVRTNEFHEILDSFCELVRPQVYPRLHFKTQEIVSISMTDLKKARTFPQVAADFFSWCQKDPVFCTWGSSDLMEFQRNLAYHHMKNPFPFPLFYYDIQKIFSILYEDRKTRRSLNYVVDYLQLPKQQTFHDALHDAMYTALIMQHLSASQMLVHSSVDYFQTPHNRRQEIYLRYPTYTKFVSKPFDSKILAIKDRVVSSVFCPECKKPAARIANWFPGGGRNYYAAFRCKKHGFLKGKIRIRQQADGTYYAIKTIKPVERKEISAILERKEKLSRQKSSS